MSDIMIELKNLSYAYPKREVLHHLNLKIHRGERLAIMGASGSGKSTLLAILGLLTRAKLDQYYFMEKDMGRLSADQLAGQRSRSLGFVFQSFLLLPTLTVLENVLLPVSYTDGDFSLRTPYALELLERVGMQDYQDIKPRELSGGQQQRVAIARALINAPDVILADEPTGSLDQKNGQEVMNYLTELNQKQNLTLVIVTHSLEVAASCDRTIVLKDGRFIT